MDYIGDTEDLEEYLEEIHRKEARKMVLKINYRKVNPLR
jgi:hypothetical protein